MPSIGDQRMATPSEFIHMSKCLDDWGLPELPRNRILSFVPRLVTYREHRMLFDGSRATVHRLATVRGDTDVNGLFIEHITSSTNEYCVWGIEKSSVNQHLVFQYFVRDQVLQVWHENMIIFLSSEFDNAISHPFTRVIRETPSLYNMLMRLRDIMPFPPCEQCRMTYHDVDARI